MFHAKRNEKFLLYKPEFVTGGKNQSMDKNRKVLSAQRFEVPKTARFCPLNLSPPPQAY